MVALIVGILLIAFCIFACLPMGLAWTADVLNFLRGCAPVLAAFVEETGIPMRGKDGMTYRGDQTGFNWCTRPIINIEMGHLSNPDDDKLLSDASFQKVMAQGLCNGLLQFFSEYGKPGT